MNTTHRIRRQVWQVRTPNSHSALAIRQLLRSANESHLQPALAQAFDQFHHAEHRHLPRLEVHIQLHDSPQFMADLLQQLTTSVHQALQQQLIQVAPPQPKTDADGLLHYLHHGEIIWQASHVDSDTLVQQLSKEAERWAQSMAEDWISTAARLPAHSQARFHAFYRLLSLLRQPSLMRCLAAAASQAGPSLQTVITAAMTLATDSASSQRYTLDLATAMTLALVSDTTADARSLMTYVQPWLAASTTPALQHFWQQLSAYARPSHHVSSPVNNRDMATLPIASTPVQPPLPETDAGPGIPIRLAGLVLLAPWLSTLFSALHWYPANTVPGSPFPPRHVATALRLLHWLATHREQPLDFELGTAKILLGLDPATPVLLPPAILDSAILTEGQALLEATIRHWPALGNISTSGLQTAFLQRNGLYYHSTHGGLLRLHPQSYDMLLDQLPWSIGMLRLPWSKHLLQVEWHHP